MGRFACLALLLVLALPLAAQDDPAANEGTAPPIADIVIQGLKVSDPVVVSSRLQSRQGQPFDTQTLREDIRRLYATGLFRNIKWTEQQMEGGIRLTIILEESLFVQSVSYENLKNLRPKDFEENLKTRVGDPLSDYILKLDADTIREAFEEEGFAFADVQPSTRPAGSGINVTFVVREGPKVSVDDIHFHGDGGISPKELQRIMKLQEPSWFSSHPFRRTELRDDLLRLRMYYRAHGWLDASVELESLDFNFEKNEVDVTFYVQQGRRYDISAIEFTGYHVFGEEQLREGLVSEEGKPYNGESIDRDIDRIRRLYGERAYVDAEVQARPRFADEAGKLVLLFDIHEGGKVFVERIEIEGNRKTRDDVIRRELRIYPGEEFNSTSLRRSFDRLQALNYFSNISVRTEPGEAPDTRNLILQVDEGQTGAIRFGGGVSSNSGIIGILELNQRNFDITDLPKSWGDFFSGDAFAGGGQYLRLSFEPGTERTRYGIDFREPYLFDQPYGLSLSLFGFDRDRYTYREKRQGGSIGLDRRFEETGWTVGVGFRIEEIRLTSVDHDAPRTIREIAGESSLRSVIPSVELDRRNSLLRPSRGYLVRASYELAGTALGGDYDFSKVLVGGDWYHTIYTTPTRGLHILDCNTRLGWSDAHGGSPSVPAFERFYAGGTGSLRGFEFRTVGPKEDDEPIGGQALLLASAEYTLPLYRPEMRSEYTDVIRLAFFVDAGTVEHRWNEIDADDIRVSTGFGIRFTVPQLGSVPIALDFGFPLRKRSGDDTQFFHLNLGYSF